jgi:signal transduction histidine kinase
VYVDPEGRAWIAPSTGGLYSMLHGRVTHIVAAGLDRDVIYSIDGGPGELWLGRQRDGLTHLRLQNGGVTEAHTYTQADGLPQNRIYAVRRNPDGSVWAATLNGGISLLRNGRFTTFSTANGLPANSVTAIEDTTDATWFGTPQGLTRLSHAESYDHPQWRTLTSADGLPSSDINCLLVDSSGLLWIGTSSGLSVLRSGHIQSIANLPAALREPIFGMAEDQHGSLWIATSTRLLSVDTAGLLAASSSPLHLREYGSADGLPGTETVRRNRSVVADSRGRIWLSLNQGLASIDPSRAFADSTPALTQVESITADGNPVSLDAPVSLPASTQRLTFDYAGLSLGVPERVRFRYRLDGFDRDWSGPVSTRQAVYTNLSPGNYRFRVLSSNSDGQWGEQEASYSFHIAPAVWQTWWFQLSLVATLGILTSLIFRWRMLQMAERLKFRFEERLAERTRIAQELHDTLLQGFLSASMQLHVTAEQLPPESPVRSSLDRILELMQQVNQEGRNTLRGLRSESSALTLEQALSRVPNELSPANPAAFRVIVQGPSRSLHPVIRDEASRIGREAIVNAFLHSRATDIEVEVEYTASHLRLCVRDDGIGIDPEVLHSGREGHWGLIGMRERAGHIGAMLKVFSRAEAGTEVELTVPGHIAYENPRRNLRLRFSRLWERLRRRTAN